MKNTLKSTFYAPIDSAASGRLDLQAGGGDFHEIVRRIFADNGVLARSLKAQHREYEERPQQRDMALQVVSAIEDEKHLMVEAGTGTGKSYAYLVPFILWALHENKRVLISTHTKTLQQQLVDKDLPFLQEVFSEQLGLEFQFALCLGTQNYICPRRLKKFESVGLFATSDEARELEDIRRYARRTSEGHLLDLPFEPNRQLWSQINRETDLCLGKKCPFYDQSFYYMARRRQMESQILVSNHHLLFANLAAGGNESDAILPQFSALVIDEAHQIEDVATSYLGGQVSNYSVGALLNRLWTSGTRNALNGCSVPKVKNDAKKFSDAVSEAKEANARFFENVMRTLRFSEKENATRRLTSRLAVADDLSEPLARLERILLHLKDVSQEKDEGSAREFEGYARRCGDFKETLEGLLLQDQKNWVYWAQLQPRSGKFGKAAKPLIALQGAPIDIGEELQERLFEKVNPVIMASATLTTAESFDYIQGRLGLTDEKIVGDEVTDDTPVRTTILGSPFNYREQTLIYLPRRMPDPKAQNYDMAAAAQVAELLPLQEGGTFVLCTSHRSVQQISDALADLVPSSHTILRQGESSRSHLLRMFREESHPVLVGTTSFWQGIDIPGQSLSCVVIVKLPFASPRDPMVEARTEFLKENGKNGFMEYQVPQAVMMFRQGFGRLIRTANDRGIVAILDPRVRTRPYGKYFLKSLPECPVTQNIADVAQFWKEH